MSVREEDRQKNSCPSRGLGIAAAAIGVGVGAALYYFFSKRQEQPHTEGSTSEWSCERPQTFHESDDSYTTVSENETSDTSIHESFTHNSEPDLFIISPDEESSSDENSSFDSESNNESFSDGNTYQSEDSYSTESITEWDVTSSSLGVPDEGSSLSRSPLSSFLNRLGIVLSPRRKKREDEQMTVKRQQAFRERSWTLEECSICFDVMLRNQEVTSLPCAHNFHTECIMPWLQEKQTCPNCRKVAE